MLKQLDCTSVMGREIPGGQHCIESIRQQGWGRVRVSCGVVVWVLTFRQQINRSYVEGSVLSAAVFRVGLLRHLEHEGPSATMD